MRIALFALLAFTTSVSGDVNLDGVEHIIHKVTQAMHHHFGSALNAVLQEHVHPRQFPLHKFIHNDHAGCGNCTEGAAKFVITHAASKVKGMCVADGNKSCFATKLCQFMGEHPNVTMGVIIGHVRPLALATSYCVGKQACDMPDNETMADILTGREPHEALLEHFDNLDLGSALQETHDLVLPPPASTEENGTDCPESNTMPKVCPKCMKHAMKHVMGKVLMKVKGMCTTTTDSAKKQQMCKWAATHKPTALGMLLMKVEPWKFAMGFCMHRGRHGQGRRGHGGRHGHRHGHHGHNGSLGDQGDQDESYQDGYYQDDYYQGDDYDQGDQTDYYKQDQEQTFTI